MRTTYSTRFVSAESELNPGSIVMVDVDFVGRHGSKLRPVLILTQAAGDDYVAAPISTNTSRSYLSSHLLIDERCSTTGLNQRGVARCDHLITIHRNDVRNRKGFITQPLLEQARECLKSVFELA